MLPQKEDAEDVGGPGHDQGGEGVYPSHLGENDVRGSEVDRLRYHHGGQEEEEEEVPAAILHRGEGVGCEGRSDQHADDGEEGDYQRVDYVAPEGDLVPCVRVVPEAALFQ